jgi:hypothetical protein
MAECKCGRKGCRREALGRPHLKHRARIEPATGFPSLTGGTSQAFERSSFKEPR